jgi:AAA ATPase domain/Bacterial transcriptional activator domain
VAGGGDRVAGRRRLRGGPRPGGPGGGRRPCRAARGGRAVPGDLLEGRHDEWLLGERERLRQRFLGALERLTALLQARGEVADAIGYAERLLLADPLREDAYRLLMRLHDARGDRARALRTYHACAATLERELGVAPSAPTRRLYEDLLPTGAERPTRPAGSLGGPPLVGRASEWTRLTTLWRAAEGGGARLLLVTGEPGIGKTRLVEELRSWCAHRGAATAEARSYAAEGALAYGPVVAWLRSAALAGSLDRLDRPRLAELARLLPELRSAVPGLPPPQPLPDDDQRQVLFDALAQAILAPGGPLLLVADDLHWADRETLRFLHYLLRSGPDAPLLVAATARREELAGQHPLNDLLAGLRGLERLVEVELGRLSREETGALAERFAGRPLGQGAERLFAETEGNPLFVVEALRAGWSSGERRLSPKVQAVIESRLARLPGPARELVGVAATIGRAFTSDVLAAACDLDERALVGGLDELWRRRIVRDQGADAYDFTHDRVREVAYRTLSPARRRRTHPGWYCRATRPPRSPSGWWSRPTPSSSTSRASLTRPGCAAAATWSARCSSPTTNRACATTNAGRSPTNRCGADPTPIPRSPDGSWPPTASPTPRSPGGGVRYEPSARRVTLIR